MSDTGDQGHSLAHQYEADPLEVNRRIVEEYRATGDHVAGFSGPSRILLLTTAGARIGLARRPR